MLKPLAILGLALFVGCSGSTDVKQAADNPAPSLHALVPTQVMATSSAFTLTIYGSGFMSGTQVRWNGLQRSATLVNDTTLTLAIAAADVSTAASIPIVALNPTPGGGTSGTVTFTVTAYVPPAAPLIVDVEPPMAVAGASAVTLDVSGSSFTDSSVVRWNGVSRPTTLVASGWLRAVIPASDLPATGSATVTVYTPGAPGATSAGRPFAIVSGAAGHPHTWTLSVATVGNGPLRSAVSSQGTVYVARNGTDSVARINLSAASVFGSFQVVNHPSDVIFNAAGTTAYVTGDAGVAVINATTHTVTTIFPLPVRPLRVCLGLGETKLYVSLEDGTVAVLNAVTGAAIASIAVGSAGNGIAPTPDGSRVWVGTTYGSLEEINTAADTVARTITSEVSLQDVVITPDGSTLFAASVNMATIYAYDLTSLAELGSISLPSVYGLAVTPDGSELWATQPAFSPQGASTPGEVNVIDVATRRIIGVRFIALPTRYVTFTPDGSAALATTDMGWVEILK